MYILTSPKNFMAFDQFLWPFCFAVAACACPLFIHYVDHNAKLRSLPSSHLKGDYSWALAMTYMTFSYLLGLFFFLLPEIYQNHIRGQSEYEMMLSKSLGNGYNIICSNQTNE